MRAIPTTFLGQDSWQFPAWSTPALTSTQWAVVCFGVAWLILVVARGSRRSGLNLTSVDMARQANVPPATYELNREERRESILARGDEYSRQQPALGGATGLGIDATHSELPWCRWSALARIGAIATAGLNILVSMGAALSAGQDVNQMVESVSLFERWEAILNRYWVGILVATVIIGVEVARLFSRRRNKSNAQAGC